LERKVQGRGKVKGGPYGKSRRRKFYLDDPYKKRREDRRKRGNRGTEEQIRWER